MLPALRSLDFMPSPAPERPGLLIRDPYGYSDATLIVPPALAPCLQYFDGEHTELDLRAHLVKITGDLDVSRLVRHLVDSLSEAGFLNDEKFAERKQSVEESFAAAPAREPVHAGAGYPGEAPELSKTLAEYLDGTASSTPSPERVLAIAAPHVSPFGGVEAYRAAYSALSPEDAERTFVILGTSHYGHPDRLGLTRKAFETPFGATITDTAIVDQIATQSGEGALMEDYCHAVEHSIEFQVIFLQHLFGPGIRIVPVLCGPYMSVYQGGRPEDSEPVRRALGALGELAAKEGDRLLWVLGVDMAHIGRRYGDRVQARAGEGEMEHVERRDRARIQQIEQADPQSFWEQVKENHDDLKWCGSAPIYTFMRAVPQARGNLLHYQQWNIDDASVVSFAGMAFHQS
jgi:AmmeMemoRadiSam system protein B